MKLLRHGVAALVIFSVLISLFLSIHGAFIENYSLTEGDIKNPVFGFGDGNNQTGNIATQLKNLNIIKGIDSIARGISELNPSISTTFDILGGAAAIGIGVIQAVIGLITFPYAITNIIVFTFYGNEIAAEVAGLAVLIAVYVGFIIVSAYLKHDV